MLFNSYAFAFLVLGTLLFYYQKAFSEYQVIILILSSMIFYGYSQPYLLLLLVASASINAVTSYFVYREPNIEKRKIWAITGVIFNLAVLSFFKYNRLLGDVFPGAFSQGGDLVNLVLAIPLPIGISFYTFQGISLVLDVYNREVTSKIPFDANFLRHYRNTFFFIAFFPQLVAGPIVKAQNFYPQIKKKVLSEIDIDLVFKSLVVGYFLKSVIADNLKDQTFWIAYPYFEFMSSLTLVVMLFGYSMQIFADFAGYSLIAIGVAAIFGYRLPENFNFPYISTSIAEFWRRWHISLSSWLKEYLYFRLGGNRKGSRRTYVNLLIVMFLGGLWHGASLSFGVWGLWHGAGLAVERYVVNFRRLKDFGDMLPVKALKLIFVFLFVSFGWLLFKLTNFSQAIDYLAAIQANTNFHNHSVVLFNVLLYSLPVALYHVVYLLKQHCRKIYETIHFHDHWLYAMMLFLILVNGGIPGEFVYFQF